MKSLNPSLPSLGSATFPRSQRNRSRKHRIRRRIAGYSIARRTLSLEPLEHRRLLAAAPLEEWLSPLAADSSAEIAEAARADSAFCEADASGHTLCFDPAPQAPGDLQDGSQAPAADGPEAAPYPLAETFHLHSYPGATKTIYLDFDGHVTTGTIWNSNHNNGNAIVTPAYSYEGGSDFSDGELGRIQAIWERVAEDFRPFAVNVTTEDPGVEALKKSGTGDDAWGIRVLIGGSSTDWYTGGGGVAYVSSFDWDSDTPAFCFEDNLANGHERYTAECISHETGHTLGLGHDGTSSVEYYEGHGSGVTGWAPIMGNGYYQLLTQWSKGEYPDASRTQDDLNIITTTNGFGYRPDDHGDSLLVASPLNPASGVVLAGEGIIGRDTDVDYFSFTTGSGTVSIDIDPFYRSPNLDILATLYDELGNEIASSNPVDLLDASFDLTVSAGTYYVAIDGTGKLPQASNYSDYGSLGYYQILGSAAPLNQPPTAVDDAYQVWYDTARSVSLPGVLQNDSDPDGDTLTAIKVSDPAHGSLSLNADGSFTYTPATGYIGTDSFQYRVSDGTADSDPATVTLEVIVPQVAVGEHRLLPGQANQAIPIYVTGGIPVQGINFNVQVADGGPEGGGTVDGPTIQDLDILTGTIFAGNNTGAGEDSDGSGVDDLVPQFESRDTTTLADTVIAEGLIGTLVIDTSGFTEGSWDLVMSLTLNGPTDFTVVPAAVIDGTITIDQLPTISDIGNQTTAEDTATGAIAFTVGDAETAAADLTVTATSDNPALIPNGNISLGGSDANRTLSLTPAANEFGTATITVSVFDGTSSSSDTFQLTVTEQNDLPTVSPIADQTIPEDAATGILAFTIGDVETAAASLTVTAASDNTSLVPNSNLSLGGSDANRTIRVTPAANQFGTATITVTVSDGSDSVSETFQVAVTAENDVPTISDIGNQATVEDTATGGIAFTVGDVETAAANLTVTATSNNPALVPNGNISLGGSAANRTISLTPVANQFGTATITVTVSDGTDSASETFLWTVSAVNDLPTISDIGNQATAEDTATGAIAFTIGDVETAAADLTVTATSDNPALIPNGNISLGGSAANRTLSLTPAANAFGTATITVTVSDGTSSSSDTFQMTVTAVNDLPTISGIADQEILEDSATGSLAFTIGDVETPVADLTVTATSDNPALVPNGNISLGGSNANRTISLVPAASQYGSATITVTVSDGSGSVSDTFLLNVTAENDVPTISDIGNQATAEDTATGAIPFTVGDVETAAADLTVTATSDNPALVPNGNISLGGSAANRTISLTPIANQFGTATITVTVSDGTSSSSDTFLWTVNAVNDLPTISDIGSQTTAEDTATGSIAFTIGDVETAAANLTVTAISDNPTLVPNGSISLGGSDASRTVRVTPAANQFGSAIITVTVSDGTASVSDVFQMTVTAVNDTPTISSIANRATAEDTGTSAIAFTVDDVETAAANLTVTATSSDSTLVPNGNISLGGSGANRTITLTPAADQFGTATITVAVSDGVASRNETFELWVTPVNDVPTLSSITNQSADEDAAISEIPVQIGDVESAADLLVLTATSDNPALVPNGNLNFGGSDTNRTLSVTPVANQYGSATITVSVSDGILSASDTFQVTFHSVNDAPNDITLSHTTLDEHAEGAVIGLVTVIDPDQGDTHTTTVSDSRFEIVGGELCLKPGVSLHYEYDPTINLDITAEDAQGLSKTESFLITVSDLNDLPLAEPQSVTTGEDRSLAITLDGNDLDGDALTYLVAVMPSHGTLSGTAPNLTYTPDLDYHGPDSFQFTVGDGIATSSAASVDITVTPTADVVARSVFYNNSSWDGQAAAANEADDNAVATDKQALLPGQTATFANYTSFISGINGIMIDVDDLPAAAVLTAADFQFRVGNADDLGAWTAAPAPVAIETRPGAGAGGSTRVTLIWDDANAVKNQWLEITFQATANTGLVASDVFYFGNAPAESGNTPTDAQVNATDEILARNHPRNFLSPATIDDPHDYNRDGRVNATDEILARNHTTSFLTSLRLISLSAAAGAAAPALPVQAPVPAAPLSTAAEGEAPTEGEAPAIAERAAGLPSTVVGCSATLLSPLPATSDVPAIPESPVAFGPAVSFAVDSAGEGVQHWLAWLHHERAPDQERLSASCPAVHRVFSAGDLTKGDDLAGVLAPWDAAAASALNESTVDHFFSRYGFPD